MSTTQTIQGSVTWDQVAAFRLVRHHLSERAQANKLITVAGDMTGAQAQLLSAAQISLWSRTRNLHIAQVDKSLHERTLVKAACMRRTLFLVPSQDLAIFVRGTARRAEKEIRWALGKGVPTRVLDRVIEATLAALDQPRTRPEIAERVSRALRVQTRTYTGGGWGNRRELAGVPVGELTYPVVELLHLVAARGVICYGPYRGNEPTFVRGDAWVPQWKDVSKAEAERLLLRRYLRAFGPATAADFAMWSGMTLIEARAIWRDEQANLVPLDVEGWAADILREDLEPLVHARIKRPSVRLLPYFDTFLLGHKQREHLVGLAHRPQVYRAQGWIAPVLLVDGRVAGIWESAREDNRLKVRVTKFVPESRRVAARIREEAQELGRFLGFPDVETLLS